MGAGKSDRALAVWGWACGAALLAAQPARAQSLPAGALPAGAQNPALGISTLGATLPGGGSGGALASVNASTGAVTSSFAFDLPPARGQAQPSLALVYNSNAGTGVAGQGWTLNLPSITRKGVAGLPSFVDAAIADPTHLNQNVYADDYYIDGSLLVAICTIASLPLEGGNQCVNGSPAAGESLPSGPLAGVDLTGYTYFRAQVDDGARYFLSANGQTWLQQLKSGRVRIFGTPLDGTLPAVELPTATTLQSVAIGPDGTTRTLTTAVSRWCLVEDVDSYGNTVNYVWAAQESWPGVSGSGPYVPGNTLYLMDIYDTPAVGAAVGRDRSRTGGGRFRQRNPDYRLG